MEMQATSITLTAELQTLTVHGNRLSVLQYHTVTLIVHIMVVHIMSAQTPIIIIVVQQIS